MSTADSSVRPSGADPDREHDADLTIHPEDDGWTFPLYVQAVTEPNEVALMIGDTPGAVVLDAHSARQLRDYLTAWLGDSHGPALRDLARWFLDAAEENDEISEYDDETCAANIEQAEAAGAAEAYRDAEHRLRDIIGYDPLATDGGA